jgi:trans-aconitate methyltransferase
MSETNVNFSGSIPELYDRHLGPVMFEPYAADLAQRIATKPAGAVLEIACGTGIVTQRLRTHLDPAVHLVATDLSQPMIDYARATKFRETAHSSNGDKRTLRTYPFQIPRLRLRCANSV